jgi:hypothetical protein
VLDGERRPLEPLPSKCRSDTDHRVLPVKPTPRHDFPVNVWADSNEHPSPINELYRDVYTATLNHTVSIEFVPAFQRAPWPPELPNDVDEVASKDEARRTAVALAHYAVTPDAQRAGEFEAFDRAGSQSVIFYVSLEEFERLTNELRSLSDRFEGVHDSIPISELGVSALQTLVLERIIPSGQLSPRDLAMLGRASHIEREAK